MINCIFEDGGKGSLRHVTVNALIFKDNKILLAKRAANLSNPGKWGLIGGFVGRDEVISVAIAREIFEETGLRIVNLQFLFIVDNPNRAKEDRQNICFIYSCDAGEKEGEPDKESTEIRWFNLHELPSDQEIAFDHSEIIQFYLKNKDNPQNLLFKSS